jgi:anion-transporting  ArsA/GET3 family ATPase
MLDRFLQEVRQYVSIKDNIDFFTKRQSEMKNRIVEQLKELGEEDSKGNVVIELDDKETKITSVIHQKRVSKSLDMEKAEQILEAKGIKDRCIVMVKSISEEEIMAAYYEGLITEEEVDAMFPSKVTYALLVKQNNG